MKRFILASVLVLNLTSLTSQAQEPKPLQTGTTSTVRSSILRQQMILLGLYVFGINTELSKKVLKPDELRFLADNILEIATDMKETKRDKAFHKNLDEVLSQARELKANAANQAIAREKGQALLDSCAKCHWEGAGAK